jgi:hypothetical protein
VNAKSSQKYCHFFLLLYLFKNTLVSKSSLIGEKSIETGHPASDAQACPQTELLLLVVLGNHRRHSIN